MIRLDSRFGDRGFSLQETLHGDVFIQFIRNYHYTVVGALSKACRTSKAELAVLDHALAACVRFKDAYHANGGAVATSAAGFHYDFE